MSDGMVVTITCYMVKHEVFYSHYNMLHEVDHGRLEKANGAWDLLSVNVRNYHAGSDNHDHPVGCT